MVDSGGATWVCIFVGGLGGGGVNQVVVICARLTHVIKKYKCVLVMRYDFTCHPI